MEEKDLTEVIINFGKYKDKKIIDIEDRNYLIWLIKNYKFYGENKKIKKAIERLPWYDDWYDKEHPYMTRGLYK
jgi:uncharacterized protein (DUF3820 family)